MPSTPPIWNKPCSQPSNWASQTGDYANHRYSDLDQINAGNVGQLQVAWTLSTGVLRGHEGCPLVVGGTLYIHTPFPNKVFSINLADQTINWTYAPKQNADTIPVMCCDTVNRGLAYGDGKIFLQQADTKLVALDAQTGRWSGQPKRRPQGRDQHQRSADRQRQRDHGNLRRRVRRARLRRRLRHQDRQEVWTAYSIGPDASS